ncbi:MAG: hypothetical protein JRE27_10080 [Deltaproteobacteria bacterium]|nr:hypothetical protein [Deltaproteobacteria bacterium]
MLGGPAGALGLGYTSIKLNEINDELERTGRVAKDVGAITLWDRMKEWVKTEEVKVPIKFFPMPVDTESQDMDKKILAKKHPLSGIGKAELSAELQEYYGMWSAYGDAMEEFYMTNSKVYLDTTKSDLDKSKEVYAAMYSDLKFQSDTYYTYQLEQLENQAADYETYTGDAALAHLWLTEQIKALDKERLSATQKNNQYLMEMSQRTAEAIETNFSSFYRDAFRGELDSAADYFRAFCHSLTDSFSDMMGQMTKEMLFGGGSSGGSGLFSFLSSGLGSWLGGGTSLDASAGLGADWTATLWHGGGRVGRDPAPTRTMPASVFANAPRLHQGYPGLAKDEFPSILKYDETVLPPGVKPVNNVQNLTISVPFTIEGREDERFASKLSYEIEETAKRVMREEMR